MNISRFALIPLLVLINCDLFGQSKSFETLPYIHALGRYLHPSEIFQPENIHKKPGHYSNDDWAAVIDSTWGAGLPTSEKLGMFDAVWNYIDQDYGGFVNFDVNIDSLRDLWRPEIEQGVSRGRFAGIMSHFILALNEGHTTIADIPVVYGTYLNPGLPVMFIGSGWNNLRHFGAALTPLPDSSLLVIRVSPNHKLGLVPGDIVLGYDEIPWKILYNQLLEARLPLRFMGIGSSAESMTHILLQSAGMNWHLFDTIDIVKYNTGDTLHLSTSLLRYQYYNGSIWGNEQLQIPGVPMPDYLNEDYVSWGIVGGSRIGYIYVGAWFWDGYNGKIYGIGQQFYNAVDSLMHFYKTSGLIIDFRCNPGGSSGERNGGYSLLFNRSITEWGFVERGSPTNHFDMRFHSSPFYGIPANFMIPGDPATYYEKPIAVLTGPGAGSAADWSSLEMRFHPMVRVFGKPSNGAFSTFLDPSLGYSYWRFYFANGSGILLDAPNDYLIHKGAPVDERIWFTQEDVGRGKDTVVESAIAWIDSIENSNIKIPSELYLAQNYPNPFNSATTINYQIPKDTKVTLRVFNILGEEVATPLSVSLLSGSYSVEWDATGLASGVYLYRLEAKGFVQTRKMVLMR
jgi:hypothetical protein